MKNHFQILSFFAIFVLGTVCFAEVKVSDCDKPPEFVSSIKGTEIISTENLPKMVFVASRAEYYVENRNSNLKIWGKQSFKNPESEIMCASGTQTLSESQGFSQYAPTLLDLTSDKKTENSYWQFHMMADKKNIGIWNQKSRIYSQIKDVGQALAKIGGQVKILQTSHDQFEMKIVKEIGANIEVLVVYFDAYSKIP